MSEAQRWIGDREPLRDSYTPESIRHRDDEISALTTLLSPVKAGGITKTALIYGPPGSGKTVTTTAIRNYLSICSTSLIVH